MKAKNFDEIVKNLANERVQEKIKTFKKEISNALKNLNKNIPVYDKPFFYPKEKRTKEQEGIRTIVLFLIGSSSGMPQFLLEDEENTVREQLLETMNVMQKALLSKQPNENDPKPILSVEEDVNVSHQS